MAKKTKTDATTSTTEATGPTKAKGGKAAKGATTPAKAAPASTKGAPAPKATKTPKAAKPKKTGALDAAHPVLVDTGAAMTCAGLIAAMADRGLWSSPNGKTPAATLYAAILREITVKGDAARFTKTERGKFAARSPTRPPNAGVSVVGGNVVGGVVDATWLNGGADQAEGWQDALTR